MYKNTPARERYQQSEKGMAARRKYNKSKKGIIVRNRYNNSERGLMLRKRADKLHFPINNLKERGLITMENCAICDYPYTEFHHPNKKLPLHIYFLCNYHHREQHGKIGNYSILKECED
jgi:hypothetical protein